MVDERPTIPPHLVDVWNGWQELHHSRPVGFGPQGLPPQHVAAWLDLHGIETGDDRKEFFDLFLSMDETWLSWARRKSAS